MSRRVTVLVVVLLLAGCSSPLGPTDPEDATGPSTDAEPTVTPVSVPDGGPGAEGIRLGESGVVAPQALVAATEDSNRGPHVREESWTMTAGDERLLRYDRTVRDDTTGVTEVRSATGNATHVLLTERSSGTSLTDHRFSSSYSGGAERTVDGETAELSWIEAQRTSVEPLPPSDGELLRALLSVPTGTTNTSAGPTEGYRVTGTTDEPPDVLVAPWLTNVDEATVSATITGDGAVTAVGLTYDAAYDGRAVRVSYRLEYRTP